ncbi:MAG: flagellar biosynthetic protein FliR, partial [Spirochaetes bacterium]|nr:flagellar biosynthetic protein FliR [Spirochaetota bacterium]
MEYFVYHFQVFLLIMMRMSSMMIIAPFFSSGVIPFRIKALFAFLVTLVIFPVVAHKGYALTGNMGLYALLVL